jgi:hypothetical protein
MRYADYCRGKARFWTDMAEMAKRPDFRDRWLDLALPWRKLAEQTEIHGPSGSSGRVDADRAA